MYTTLISAPQLARAMDFKPDKYRILDCRARLGDPDFGAAAYAERHLPGALHIDLDTDLAAPPGSGGRHPLPDPAALVAKLRARGINDDDQVVVYDDAGGAFAARAWWCLRWLGHEATALLDGGLDAWPGPWSSGAAEPVPEPGNFSIRPALTRTINAATLTREVGADSVREPPITLIDARTVERFNGEAEPIDPVAGHIPGARCFPFQDNLEADGRFKPADLLKQRFAGLGSDVVCYCGSGVTAAHNVLAMRVAGLPEPALYAGSWSEWIVDPSRPRAP